AVFGAVGLYFHLDARSAKTDVEAKPQCTTGPMGLECAPVRTWSPAYADTYDRAVRSSTIAGVAYGVGGALLLTTAILYIVTEPDLETRTIHPHVNRKPPVAIVAPSPG